MDKNESFVAISDLHSNKEAMKKIYKYIDEGYKVVILGDVTDRGPHGDGTGGLDMLLEIKELSDSGKVIYIPGNHDELLYAMLLVVMMILDILMLKLLVIMVAQKLL